MSDAAARCPEEAIIELQVECHDLARRLEKARAHIEALVGAFPAKDAQGLARVCMSFAEQMCHKQDAIGLDFWAEQAQRLRAYAALAAKEKRP